MSFVHAAVVIWFCFYYPISKKKRIVFFFVLECECQFREYDLQDKLFTSYVNSHKRKFDFTPLIDLFVDFSRKKAIVSDGRWWFLRLFLFLLYVQGISWIINSWPNTNTREEEEEKGTKKKFRKMPWKLRSFSRNTSIHWISFSRVRPFT